MLSSLVERIGNSQGSPGRRPGTLRAAELPRRFRSRS
jgi:hypothetical protein